MNHEGSEVMTQEEFGFIAARFLAILLWASTARSFVFDWTADVSETGRSSAQVRILALIADLAVLFVGVWLWNTAYRFGSDGKKPDNVPSISLMRAPVLGGLVTALSAYWGCWAVFRIGGLISLDPNRPLLRAPTARGGSLLLTEICLAITLWWWGRQILAGHQRMTSTNPEDDHISE